MLRRRLLPNFQPLQNGYVRLFSVSETPGKLVLEDGKVFEGKMFGKERSMSGEIVFSTNMVGYPRSMTDPSFYGQIINFTYPLVGNYGVPNDEFDEFNLNKNFRSNRIWCNGILIQDYSKVHSHWKANRSLSSWMEEQDIPGLYGIDTRALTKHLREKGSMIGKIICDNDYIDLHNVNKENLVAQVSRKTIDTYGSGDIHIVAVDCGIKENIIRCLVERGVRVTVVPYNYDFNEMDFDGLFISNGPGDPSMCEETIGNIRKSLEKDKPIFGICLGNQLLAKADGNDTYKMKYGNRGQNQPVVDMVTNQAYITSQNHGYAVDNHTLQDDWKPYFINANDGSNEGLMHKTKPFFQCTISPRSTRRSIRYNLLV